ncbi:hypothetical protein Ddye_027138 [Dipteronia dyeriana]|uniref:Uncharacterized protein n=1 Tax=Dipteronia dyeriana TaxID=168575 RepID=A0AAD9TNZ4_9ROSI|nr:hypothetical protein Ddye_027138 [Dipteronia dyeriana]
MALRCHRKAVNAIHWSASHEFRGGICSQSYEVSSRQLQPLPCRESSQIVGYIRTGKVAHQFIRGLGPILDVEYTLNGKQFISASDVSGVNMIENSIIAWDISREIPLSNQFFFPFYVVKSKVTTRKHLAAISNLWLFYGILFINLRFLWVFVGATAAHVASHLGPPVGHRQESGLTSSIAGYCRRVVEVIVPEEDDLIKGPLPDLLSSGSSSSIAAGKTLNEAKADKAKLEAEVIRPEKLVARNNACIGRVHQRLHEGATGVQEEISQ